MGRQDLVRKSIAVIAVLLLLAVPIGSIFVERRLFGGSCTVLAYSVFCLGAWICVLNLYLSFLRPLVHHLLRRQGKLRNVSGIPLVGMAVVAGLLLAAPLCQGSCRLSICGFPAEVCPR